MLWYSPDMIFLTRDTALDAPVRSFASLMELYENNYIYIRRLVPELDHLPGAAVSRVAGTADLHLYILERCPYTSTLRLTHRFDGDDEAQLCPDMVVRVYHDARTAEVLPSAELARFRLWKGGLVPDPRSLEWRWEVNRFLNRWLRYCLGEGHSFRVTRPISA